MEFQLRTALCLTALALLPVTGLAQTHSQRHAATTIATAPIATGPSAPMTEGEVRKVNKVEGTMTLRHGPLENLGMPAMTMTFRVKAPSMLDKVKDGDKIRFIADSVNGKLTVVQLELPR